MPKPEPRPKSASREPATRRTARQESRRAASPWRPLLIGLGVVVALGIAWLIWRGGPASAPSRQPLEALVAGAEAGELEAFRALGGHSFGPGAEGTALRRRLAVAVRRQLTAESDVALLKAAVAAAVHHQCNDLALPTLQLLAVWPALPDKLGGPAVPAILLASGFPASPDAPQVVAGLAGLVQKQNAARDVGVAALQRLEGIAWSDVAGIDACLEACAAGLPDPGCRAALGNLLTRVYGRAEQAKALGADTARWQAFIEQDRTRARRCDEIAAWIAAHGAVDRVADGAAALAKSRDFLTPARQDLDAWLEDPAWPGPLGWKRADLEALTLNLKQAQAVNRSALAGAVPPPTPKPPPPPKPRSKR